MIKNIYERVLVIKTLNLKSVIIGVLLGVILSSFTVLALEFFEVNINRFPVIVNGVKADVEAINVDGRTFLPLRKLGEILGVSIDFINDEIVVGEEKVENTNQSTGVSPMKKSSIIDGELIKFMDGKWWYRADVIGRINDHYDVFEQEDKTWSLVYNTPTESTVIVENVPVVYYRGSGHCIEEKYFEEVILPLIK